MAIKIILFIYDGLDINHKHYFMFDILLYNKYNFHFAKWQTKNTNIY